MQKAQLSIRGADGKEEGIEFLAPKRKRDTSRY